MDIVNNAREAHGENVSILHLNHQDFKGKLLITRAMRADKTLVFYTPKTQGFQRETLIRTLNVGGTINSIGRR